MNNASRKLLESLLYKFPNLRHIYYILSIDITQGKEHKECSNIVNKFINPSIFMVIGLTTTCFIVERFSGYNYNVITIDSEAFFSQETRGSMHEKSRALLNLKDYIPVPLTRKIVIINNYKNGDIDGKIYSELYYEQFVEGNLNFTELYKYDRKDGVKSRKIINYFLKDLTISK